MTVLIFIIIIIIRVNLTLNWRESEQISLLKVIVRGLKLKTLLLNTNIISTNNAIKLNQNRFDSYLWIILVLKRFHCLRPQSLSSKRDL